MPRMFTRQKRYKQVGATSQKHRFWKGNTETNRRMKSFATEEKAKAWAKEQGLDEKTYELRRLQPEKWQWKAKNPHLDQ